VTAIVLAAVSAPVAHAEPAHGIQAYTADGRFVAPEGVSSVFIALWGAGGGGGAANAPEIGGAGGGGGGGGAAWCAVTLTPQTEYLVTVGPGGLAGIAGQYEGSGTPGGDSSLGQTGTPALAVAHGGQNGFGATADGRSGSAGRGGTGECRQTAGVTSAGTSGNGDGGGAAGTVPMTPPAGTGTGGGGGKPGAAGYVVIWW